MTSKKSLLTFLCFLFCFATIAQQTESRLQLTSEIKRKPIYKDVIFVLSLTINNTGGNVADGVLVMNNLPQELAFYSFLNEGKATHNAGSILWFAENVEVGESKTLEITVNIKDKSQPIINRAFVWQYDGTHMFFDYNSTPKNLRTELVITDVNLIEFEEIEKDIIVDVEEETEEEIVETEEIEVEEVIEEETEIGVVEVEEEVVEEIITEKETEEDLEKLNENLTEKIKRIEAELERLKKLQEEEEEKTIEEEEISTNEISEKEIEKTEEEKIKEIAEEIEILKIEKQALYDWLKNTINSQGKYLVQIKNNQEIKVIGRSGAPAMTKQNISWPTAIFMTGKESSIAELKLEITIFNRFAVTVHEGNAGWDLMYNSKPADAGIYFYMIKFPDGEKLSNSFEIQRQQ